MVQPPDNDALWALFTKLEFTRLLTRYGLHAPEAKPEEKKTFEAVCTIETVTEPERARTLTAALQKAGHVSLAAENDLSAIAVQLGDAGYYFAGAAAHITIF